MIYFQHNNQPNGYALVSVSAVFITEKVVYEQLPRKCIVESKPKLETRLADGHLRSQIFVERFTSNQWALYFLRNSAHLRSSCYFF